jgi:hypothetical protein
MSIFLFEYGTCTGDIPDNIAVEGLAMFKTLYDKFNAIAEINSFVNPELKEHFNLPVTDSWIDDFKTSTHSSDYSLIIAPEEDNLLFELIRYVEEETENLGSSSEAVYLTSDKWLTYLKLKSRVNVPESSLKQIEGYYLVKPRFSCGGNGIRISNSEEIPAGWMAQEYVRGIDMSVSLLVGDEINVLSVNRQILDDFKFRGSVVPFYSEEVVEEAIKAVESINGLFGYVGVDMVLGDVPYVIEVNPRITTPAILFEEVYGMNIAEVLIRNHEGKEIHAFKPKKSLTIQKIEGVVEGAIASCRGYSILKTDNV